MSDLHQVAETPADVARYSEAAAAEGLKGPRRAQAQGQLRSDNVYHITYINKVRNYLAPK